MNYDVSSICEQAFFDRSIVDDMCMNFNVVRLKIVSVFHIAVTTLADKCGLKMNKQLSCWHTHPRVPNEVGDALSQISNIA